MGKKQTEKRARQAKEKKAAAGVEVVEEDEYVSVAQDKRAKNIKALEYKDSIFMPMYAQLSSVKHSHPDLYTHISEGWPIVVDKVQHTGTVNSIIWYLELDKKHTFNTKNKVAAASCAFVRQALENNKSEIIPPLQLLYAMACHEYSHRDDLFIFRDKFLKYWWDNNTDIMQFSKRDIKTYSKMVQDLADALSVAVKTPTEDYFDGYIPVEERSWEDSDFEVEEEAPVNDVPQELRWAEWADEDEMEEGLAKKDERYRRDKHAEWVGEVLETMRADVDKLVAQTPPNAELIQAYMSKMRGLNDGLMLDKALKECGL